MQAAGVTPPILNLKSMAPSKAQGYPDQDRFHSLLQERIMSRGWGKSPSKAVNSSSLKQQVRQARPASSSSTSPVLHDRYNSNSTRSSMISEAQKSASRLQAEAQSRADRLSGKSSKDTAALAAAVAQPNTEMPAPLKRLTEFLNQQPGQTLKVSQDQVQELKDFLLKAGLPAAQVESLLNSDSFQTKGLTAQNVQTAWQEACQNSSQEALTAQLSQATPYQLANATVNLDLPPALKDLTDLINQQPGQALKVPPDRIPQVQSFLLEAGIPQEQVENLLNSPQVQEQGLTAANVQAAWQKGVKNSLKQALTASGEQSTSIQKLTSQPDYQSMWQKLTLPPQALGDLRLALQKLGVPPDSLTNLTAQNFPNGIPLTQVWQLIQQGGKSSSAAPAIEGAKINTDAAAKAIRVSDSTPLVDGGADLEKWRQLLTQAGMDPELAQTLTSGLSTTNKGELRASLEQLAPPANSQVQEIPKPAYLPQDVRVRQMPLLQQTAMGQGHGESNGNLGQNQSNGNLGQNLETPSEAQAQAQIPNLAGSANQNIGAADLQSFLAYLNANGMQQADQTGAGPGIAGGQTSTAVNSYLTPEVREGLWSQVQSGILGNLRPGENQVTLTLNPPDLGKLDLTLTLKGQTVEVTAITTHSAVADAAAAGVQQLAQALNQQGLILTQFQFHHQDEAAHGQQQLAFSQNFDEERQTGKKEPDNWERPATPQRQHWAGGGGIDCFA